MGRAITTTAGFLPVQPTDDPSDPVELQGLVGLDRIVTGQRTWARRLGEPLARQDSVSRIPAVTADGGTGPSYVRTGPFRPTGILRNDAGIDPDRLQVILPGPYTLFSMIDDRSAVDAIASLHAIADWLRAEVDLAPTHRTAMVLEPALVDDPPSDDVAESLPEIIDRVIGRLDDPIVYPWGGALTAKVHAHLLDADLHALGYDVVTDRGGCVELMAEYGTADAVALGCLDASAGVGLGADTIARRVEAILGDAFARTVDPIYLLPSHPLAALPRTTVEPMLAELGQVSRELTPEMRAE